MIFIIDKIPYDKLGLSHGKKMYLPSLKCLCNLSCNFQTRKRWGFFILHITNIAVCKTLMPPVSNI